MTERRERRSTSRNIAYCAPAERMADVFEWRRMMTLHAALTGAGLSIKVRGDNRRVRELIPIEPGQWDVRKDFPLRAAVPLLGRVRPDRRVRSRRRVRAERLQWDWTKSMNAVTLARSAIGLAMATERSQAAMHENGLRPSGVYTVDASADDKQHER
jgi:phage portal protein BeeE